MKGIKKTCTLILTYVLVIASCSPCLVKAYEKNGFTYNKAAFSTIEWKTKDSVDVKSTAGGLLGRLNYYIGVGRYKKSSDYIVMIAMAMEPNDQKVKLYKVDNHMYYGYGFSEYLSVSTIVPGELGGYKPVNTPSSDKLTLSLGCGKDDTSVGVSYEIVHNDLDITARCSTSSDKYYVVYDYLPNIWNMTASNKYVANESQQYGMAQFTTDRRTQQITFNFDVRFGAAEDNAAKPWNIYPKKIFRATKSVTYTFKF